LPANLTAEAKGLWNKASQAKTVEEKIHALQEFLSAVPKHKGNERLRAQVKRKIAILKLEATERKQRRAGGRGEGWFIQKQGAAQIVLIGQTNVGRSSLLSRLTNAKPTIASRKFTTTRPVPGIMNFEDLQFQLVEAPALVRGAADGEGWGLQTLGLARNADGIIIVVDLSEDPVNQLDIVLAELEGARISARRSDSNIFITSPKEGGGIRVMVSGHLLDCNIGDVQTLLTEYVLSNAVIRIVGEARLNDIEDALLEATTVFKPTIVAANKLDISGARKNLEALSQKAANLPVIPVSCTTGENIHQIGDAVFGALSIIRVYTKEPNEDVRTTEPFVISRGSTVGELAKRIHTELHENFRFARVWGSTAKFPGEKVGLEYVLGDRDTVEIHTR